MGLGHDATFPTRDGDCTQYGASTTVEEPGCGKSHTNNLPTPADLTENHYAKKIPFFKAANQKSVTLVRTGIGIELEPTWSIFENVLIFEIKGGC